MLKSVSVLQLRSREWKTTRRKTRGNNFTSQSDGKCFRRNPGPSASRARLPWASPPPSVTQLTWRLEEHTSFKQFSKWARSESCVKHLTSEAEIPTLAPVLKARSRFSFCENKQIRSSFYILRFSLTVDSLYSLTVFSDLHQVKFSLRAKMFLLNARIGQDC